MDQVGDWGVKTVHGVVDPDVGLIAIGHYFWADALPLTLKECRKLITKPASFLDALPAVLCARK